MKKIAFLALLLAGCGSGQPQIMGTRVLMEQAYAIDGDTFDAGYGSDRERYRLARIDAPEMPGHCRPGRHCVAGDPWRSQRALQYQLNQGVRCQASGKDVYDRWLVECWIAGAMADGPSVNDSMLELGFAQRYRR
jgi:micrococcal nuclease